MTANRFGKLKDHRNIELVYCIVIMGRPHLLHRLLGDLMYLDQRGSAALRCLSRQCSHHMLISIISMVFILPRFENQISTPFLATYNLVCVGLSLLFYLLTCVGIAPYDKPENFEEIKLGGSKDSKPGMKDMWKLIRDNKELQRYMISAVSDKLAQTVASVSVISVLLYGIMIGNYDVTTIISTVAMPPGIIFAIIGAGLAGKHGNRKVMVDWTWACIGLNVLYALFLLFSDTTQITKAVIPTVLFFIFTLGNNAVKMVVSTTTVALRMEMLQKNVQMPPEMLTMMDKMSVEASIKQMGKLITPEFVHRLNHALNQVKKEVEV